MKMRSGSGYPNGLTGDKIHPFAKIIHVADVYDALSSDRAYKKAYTYSESLEYLMGGCGTLFDQQVVRAFMDKVPVYPKGVTVYYPMAEKPRRRKSFQEAHCVRQSDFLMERI